MRAGRHTAIVAFDGPLDEHGVPHPEPVLKRLLSRIGKGEPANLKYYLPSDAAFDSLAGDRSREKRTRQERIRPAPFNQALAGALVMMRFPRAGSGEWADRPLMASAMPEGDDIELCLSVNRRGDRLLLAINWTASPWTFKLTTERACFDRPPREAYLLGPDGKWAPWRGSFRPELTLKGQEALVARLAGE